MPTIHATALLRTIQSLSRVSSGMTCCPAANRAISSTNAGMIITRQ